MNSPSSHLERAMKARKILIESIRQNRQKCRSQVEMEEDGLQDSFFILILYFCNGYKPLLIYFLVFLFYMSSIGQVKMGQITKNMWVQKTVKAHRTRVLTQISLSLSLFLSFYYSLAYLLIFR